jgi:hypothetical protein
MIAEMTRRRSGFQDGAWIRMADGKEWLFSRPPAPGADAQYDALIQCLLEAEDQHEARRIELAITISLLSRNYQPSPREFQEILSFGGDDAARSSAQEAISTLIRPDIDQARRRARTGRSGWRS